MPNYRGGLGYGGRSFHQVSSLVGGQGMRGDVFSALGQLGNVSGAAVGSGSGGNVPIQPMPLRFDGLESGNVSLAGTPSGASVGASLSGGSVLGSDVSSLLAGLPPELQAMLMQQVLGLPQSGGMVPSGSDSAVFEAVGRRLVELLVQGGGLEKLLGLKVSGGSS